MRTVLNVSLIFCMVCVLVSPAEAMRDRVTNEIVDRAVVIAIVTVISIDESTQSGTLYYTVHIDAHIKGALKSSNLLIRIPRAHLDDNGVGKKHRIEAGQQVTLYLDSGPQGISKSSIVLALVPIKNRIE